MSQQIWPFRILRGFKAALLWKQEVDFWISAVRWEGSSGGLQVLR